MDLSRKVLVPSFACDYANSIRLEAMDPLELSTAAIAQTAGSLTASGCKKTGRSRILAESRRK